MNRNINQRTSSEEISNIVRISKKLEKSKIFLKGATKTVANVISK